MLYTSTRQKRNDITATQAILQGISEDGGLFVPSEMPKIDFKLEELKDWSYQEVAYRVIRLFFDEFSKEDLKTCIQRAYNEKFDTEQIAPLVHKQSGYFLELFHGPTIAFKDMALSILPHFMLMSKRYQHEEKDIVILTATSGDTGKAALEGFKDVEGTKIVVFFPQDGVSDIQKQQMVTTDGQNTCVIGVRGNFDDCQTTVKEIFADEAFNKEIANQNAAFSSANSINIGRLVPQVAYYFSAYGQMLKSGELVAGEPINVVVPTGNFGNILAAYYAKQMGLPIQKLICASNRNKVLVDFFETGVYNRNREFHLTLSPSMDILISSNLERLLYHLSDEETVQALMNALKQNGQYTLEEAMKEKLTDFYSGYADDTLTQKVIQEVFERDHYLIDTHTAVAYAVYQAYKEDTQDTTKTIIVSTASPYKFTHSVMSAIDKQYEEIDDFSLLDAMQNLTHVPMPKAVDHIATRKINHHIVCNVDEMKSKVQQFLVK